MVFLLSQVSTYEHIDSVLAGGQADKYTSPHHSAQFHRSATNVITDFLLMLNLIYMCIDS